MDAPVPLNADAFHLRLLALRAEGAADAISITDSLPATFPHVVRLEVGSEQFAFTAGELVHSTGARFTQEHNYKLGADSTATITLAVTDVPSARTAVGMLQLHAPTEATGNHLAETIQALSFLNAWSAINALPAYIDASAAAALGPGPITHLLAAALRFMPGSALVQHLASFLDGNNVNEYVAQLFWTSLLPIASREFCEEQRDLDPERPNPSEARQWLWHSLAALLCDGNTCDVPKLSGEEAPIVLSISRYPGRYMGRFMQCCKGKAWCECRSRIVSTMHMQGGWAALLAAPRGSTAVVSEGGAVGCFMSILNVPTDAETPEKAKVQSLRLSGADHRFTLILNLTTRGEPAVPTISCYFGRLGGFQPEHSFGVTCALVTLETAPVLYLRSGPLQSAATCISDVHRKLHTGKVRVKEATTRTVRISEWPLNDLPSKDVLVVCVEVNVY